MSSLAISGYGLLAAFVFYTLSFIAFFISIAGSKWSKREPKEHKVRWGKWGFILSVVGFAGHIVYLIARWVYQNHIPVSNMYEYMTFFSLTIGFAFIVFYLIFRLPLLGLFSMPLAMIMIAYAAVFPKDPQPLIPGLQSKWLMIHVTTAALGEAFFAIGFVAGVMYLLKCVNFSSKEKADRRQQRGVEFTLFVIMMVVVFAGSVFAFNAFGFQAEFSKTNVTIVDGENVVNEEIIKYVLPPIVKPYQSKLIKSDSFLGLKKPLFTAPSWMEGVNAGRKLNTIIWTLLLTAIAYILLRLMFRKPLGAVINPVLKEMDAQDLDEISYRTIAIGFPIFTLGALVFAMIWAAQAWGRFWGWDPKETWALITWLFYAAYLHLRLSRGWHGLKSAWMTVIGFLLVMFTLVGVNLMIAGLHSYAGV